MENIIKVQPEVLLSTAGEFNTQGGQINALTTQMMELVNALPSTWVGEAGAAFVTKFSGLSDDIQRITNMINEHVSDLEEMAQNYTATEQQVEELTQALSSDVIV